MRRLAALALLCLLLAGFSSWPGLPNTLAAHLVAPSGASPLLPVDRIEAAYARLPARSGHVTTSAGVRLFWRALDPGDYRMRYTWSRPADDPHGIAFDLDFDTPTVPAPAPRGTVLLLHGWMMDGGSLLPWSLALGQAGYRTVAIDLRNHGHSGRGPSGYGTREAHDVVDVVAALRARGEITGPLHVFGVSYGAATALFASADPRLGAARIVALESFDNAGAAIRAMVPHMLDETGGAWTARLTRTWLRWRIDAQVVDAAVVRAGETLDLPLDQVDVGAALAGTPACVLLVHGSADRHVPVAHGRALAAAVPEARYLELAGEDHLSLPMQLERLAPSVIDWFGAPACPTTARVAAG
ncbi:alpha/beta fold hydrolase [Luteimonas sp BLCC-B24]|uniref:alpha/beta fold hydrolase n=1 Tax=Luteimonas sp. BLCC-B24 TaxID=3025317 RepID=UPI00234C5928|nr:alpha/beta fold hydrolase [Luteimonas sp. BLCC-B24]MDC7807395.1 alpha/beta fold hydrolase [Luteimonas sp. BLCC-B24]